MHEFPWYAWVLILLPVGAALIGVLSSGEIVSEFRAANAFAARRRPVHRRPVLRRVTVKNLPARESM